MYRKFVELLQKNNVTTYQVAKSTGIPQSMFSAWKHNKSKPKIEKLKKIADYFSIDVTEFIDKN